MIHLLLFSERKNRCNVDEHEKLRNNLKNRRRDDKCIANIILMH